MSTADTESVNTSEGVEKTAERVGEMARCNGAYVAVAESATGGRISSRLAAVPESSDWFLGAVVSCRTP